jgi:Protein kinase domain
VVNRPPATACTPRRPEPARRRLVRMLQGFTGVDALAFLPRYHAPQGVTMAASKESAPTAASAAVELEFPAGATFAGRYRIIRLLGQGDRKRTYLAEDALLGRKVALALIKPDSAEADPAGTSREVHTLSQVGSHDNIVTLYDRGNAEDVEYLVFAYLSGGTLREYFDERRNEGRSLSAEEIMQLGRQLARGLSHLHGQGFIHRDVAPANVWLDDRRVAHLGDFDSAIRVDAPHDSESLPVTTEAYASPEQAAGEREDERSDLFSLGAVLYEAVTGERPSRESGGSILKPLPELRPDLPRSLTSTISWLLEEAPEDRPSQAADALKALKPTRSPAAADVGMLPWAETLPFPLASILWHYEGEPDPQTKVDYLLKFFETLAQFRATVMLSACRSDPAFFAASKPALLGRTSDHRRPLDLRLATFGTWVELCSRLAKSLRRLADADADHCQELFAASDRELVDAFIGRDLNKILADALARRNSWGGHGAAASPHIHLERVHELEELLARATAVLSLSFETWTLLKPGAMTFASGIYDLTAKILKGTNPAFPKKRVQLTQALDATSLYFLNDGSTTALHLVPLIRVMASRKTGQDAVYFYNRLQRQEVRWVSYHFSADPELVLADPEVIDLLAELSPDEPGAAPH